MNREGLKPEIRKLRNTFTHVVDTHKKIIQIEKNITFMLNQITNKILMLANLCNTFHLIKYILI